MYTTNILALIPLRCNEACRLQTWVPPWLTTASMLAAWTPSFRLDDRMEASFHASHRKSIAQWMQEHCLSDFASTVTLSNALTNLVPFYRLGPPSSLRTSNRPSLFYACLTCGLIVQKFQLIRSLQQGLGMWLTSSQNRNLWTFCSAPTPIIILGSMVSLWKHIDYVSARFSDSC